MAQAVDRCCVRRQENSMNLFVSIRAFGWPGALSMSSHILKGIFFFWAVGLNSGLKIFHQPCCQQMYRHLGFAVRFGEHRQSRLSIILKDPRIFGIVKEHWLCLQSPFALAPNKRFTLSFEAWQPGLDFSCVPMKSPRWHLLPIKGCFTYTASLLCTVTTFIHYLFFFFHSLP